jgi:(E)-4-hydroxy-3-methylbut-2-enyl-diphosphate synthase
MFIPERRITPTVKIGDVLMGSGHPVVVQSMTNTPTADIKATVDQIKELADAGSELVRITVNDFEAMEAVPEIVHILSDQGYNTPIIGDFHYNGHVLLTKYPKGCDALAKFRINPGNVGKGNKHDENFATMIKAAIDHDKPVRIGVNWGSLDQEIFTTMMDENAALPTPKSFKEVVYDAMVKSAMDSAQYAESIGLSKENIVLSVKMSDVQDMVRVYEMLCAQSDYVMHLGLTEAGGSLKGVAASSAALAILLQKGLGDTIRISLTPEPGKSRDLEVKACRALLQSLGLRFFMPAVTSCPGCGRTNSDKFVHLAKDVTTYIEQKMPSWKGSYPGVEKLNIAVMGCVVNGPGESKYADIGISLPGASEKPAIPIYKDGELFKMLEGDSPTVKEDFIQILEDYIQARFA